MSGKTGKTGNVHSLPGAVDLTGIADGPPADLCKLAVWRKGVPNPLTFEVRNDAGDAALRMFADGADHVEFETYDHGGQGRVSTSVFHREDLSGLTLEAQVEAPRIARG